MGCGPWAMGHSLRLMGPGVDMHALTREACGHGESLDVFIIMWGLLVCFGGGDLLQYKQYLSRRSRRRYFELHNMFLYYWTDAKERRKGAGKWKANQQQKHIFPFYSHSHSPPRGSRPLSLSLSFTPGQAIRILSLQYVRTVACHSCLSTRYMLGQDPCA